MRRKKAAISRSAGPWPITALPKSWASAGWASCTRPRTPGSSALSLSNFCQTHSLATRRPCTTTNKIIASAPQLLIGGAALSPDGKLVYESLAATPGGAIDRISAVSTVPDPGDKSPFVWSITPPVPAGAVYHPGLLEKVAVTPDGKYVLATDASYLCY